MVDSRKEDISSKSKQAYSDLRNIKQCPICQKQFKSMMQLSWHFTNRHDEGRFEAWFKLKYPNYCRKCSNEIWRGNMADIYRVSFCSIKCKSSIEFKTEKQLQSSRESMKKMVLSNIGRQYPRGVKHKLTDAGHKALADGARIRMLAHNPWKGKKLTPQERQELSSKYRQYWEKSWRGNLSRFQAIIRMALYDSWTKLILERDGYTCQHCGKPSGAAKIAVHHIIRFRDLILNVLAANPHLDITNYEHKWQLQEACLAYPALLDLNNGITLCHKCHQEVHRKNMLLKKAA